MRDWLPAVDQAAVWESVYFRCCLYWQMKFGLRGFGKGPPNPTTTKVASDESFNPVGLWTGHGPHLQNLNKFTTRFSSCAKVQVKINHSGELMAVGTKCTQPVYRQSGFAALVNLYLTRGGHSKWNKYLKNIMIEIFKAISWQDMDKKFYFPLDPSLSR